MPDIAPLHPIVVHFVIAGLFVGLPLYILGFSKRPAFLRPAATLLLVVGTVAAFVAVKSGDDAHGPAERIPDTRDLVVQHEELGERTRNVFAGVLLLELIALGLAARAGDAAAGGSRVATALRLVVAAGWVAGAFFLFEAAEHGGELVYEYAGGVGFRSDDPDGDVTQLLRAGLYHQSRIDREAGRGEAAARLVDEMVARYPQSVEVGLLGVESLLVDREDGRAALDALARIRVPAENERMRLRHALHTVDAYVLLALPDSARAALRAVPDRYLENGAVVTRRNALGG
jgi:uncharacterized membrane protein